MVQLVEVSSRLGLIAGALSLFVSTLPKSMIFNIATGAFRTKAI